MPACSSSKHQVSNWRTKRFFRAAWFTARPFTDCSEKAAGQYPAAAGFKISKMIKRCQPGLGSLVHRAIDLQDQIWVFHYGTLAPVALLTH